MPRPRPHIHYTPTRSSGETRSAFLAGPYNLAFFNRHNEAYRTSAAVHYVHAKQHDVLQLTPLDRHAEWDTRFNDDVLAFLNGQPHTGLLAILANWLLSVTGGDLTVTAMAILWSSAILSSIVDNIPFVATMIPLIKEMAPTFGGPEGLMPLWWALSLGACLGGNGTIVGASANLTVAGMAERTGIRFSFIEYMKVGYPMMLVSVVIATAYLYLRYL